MPQFLERPHFNWFTKKKSLKNPTLQRFELSDFAANLLPYLYATYP